MKITKLHITNFKSIRELELINPNPFSVFVGPNGAGKSNIFEALEFSVLLSTTSPKDAVIFYERLSDILYAPPDTFKFSCDFGEFNSYAELPEYDLQSNSIKEIIKEREFLSLEKLSPGSEYYKENKSYDKTPSYKQFFGNFVRLFLNHTETKRQLRNDSLQLASDASNLEKVLERILESLVKRQEILEWLQVLIPEFKDIQIESSKLDGKVYYIIYEKHTNKPFPKRLISDGTKNILALLTAVYQSDEPQFLCIEEPENGLHPDVIESLVGLFRNACKEKGHYIWLNTHSQTLVRQLTAEEIIVVDKKEGSTQVRQFQGRNFHGLKMDEAWLTNALGGGVL